MVSEHYLRLKEQYSHLMNHHPVNNIKRMYILTAPKHYI